jgi:Icc protein
MPKPSRAEFLTGQFGPPDHTILHISDTHLTASGRLLGRVDPVKNLTGLLAGVRRSSISPDLMLFTGDLTDAGDPAAYARLRALVEPVAQSLGAQVLWLMGNHDSRSALRRGLLDLPGTEAPLDRVHMLGGLRLVALDTSVPGEDYGELSAAQLDWLASVLAEPAPEGTVLAMHHPPLPSPLGVGASIELHDIAGLERVVAGTDVRAVLAGHLHYATTSTFAGSIPVSVAAATCYTEDLQVVFPYANGVDGGQSYNLVHVYPDRLLHSVVPLGDFATVMEFTEADLREVTKG